MTAKPDLISYVPVTDVDAYVKIETRVRKGDLDALLARWECGRRLLAERGTRQRLPKGRLSGLANALALSKAELKNRIQFAEEHPTRTDVQRSFEAFGSWSEICGRGLGSRGLASDDDTGISLPQLAAVADLKPHPRDYKRRAPAEIDRLTASIKEHGVVGPVIVARDNTVLIGQDAVLAAQAAELPSIPVIRTDYDAADTNALKLMVSDCDNGRSMHDVRMLVEILKDIRQAQGNLDGTGFDAARLTNLIFASTSRSEFATHQDAALWAGLPEYQQQPALPQLVVTFDSAERREKWVESHGLKTTKRESRTWSARFPEREPVRVRTFRWSGEGLQVCIADDLLNDAERDFLEGVRADGTTVAFVDDPDWREPPTSA